MALHRSLFDEIPYYIRDEIIPDGSEFDHFDPTFNFDLKDEFQVDFLDQERTSDELVQSNQKILFESSEYVRMTPDEDTQQVYFNILPPAKFDMDIEMNGQQVEETPLPEDNSKIPEINKEALCALIERAMRGFEPNDQELQELADIEKVVLLSIKEKKWSTDEERNNKGKRVEEKQKLFFKAAFKFAEKKYFDSLKKTNNNKKIKKRDLNHRDFYEHYFAEVAERSLCDISNFFHPNKKLKGASKKSQCILDEKGTAGLKSFNSTYIDLILSSENFRNDSIEFLECCFLQEYTKTRSQKIEKFVKQITKLVQNTWIDYQFTKPSDDFTGLKSFSLKETILMKIKDNILNNPKSKLPWSNQELEEAKQAAAYKILKAQNSYL